MNRRMFLTLTSVGALAACGTWQVDYPTAPVEATNWRVDSVSISIPDKLTVSKENALAPQSDIVWWEGRQAYGKERVKEILTAGARSGAAVTNGSRSVRLGISLIKFHGMTPRATTNLAQSGVHNIQFYAQIFDSATGAALTEPTHIYADVAALHGAELNNAIRQGKTDRVRVTNSIASAIAGWLGAGADVRNSFTRIGV